jgi:hypothetical protein
LTVVNTFLGWIFDLLMMPLQRLDDRVALAFVSLATAVFLLLAIRLTSNQQALSAIKRQIHADLFEIRLFNDDLGAMLRAEGDILRHNATYLRLSLVPMLWTIIPLGLLVAQLDAYFGYAAVPLGQPIILTAQLKAAIDEVPLTLALPAGLHADTADIRFPSLQQVAWRIVPEQHGGYVLRIRIGAETYEKTMQTSDGLVRRSPVRVEANVVDQLVHPSEPPLPKMAPVASIRVTYPVRRIQIFGWELPWVAVYVGLSIVFVLILKSPLGVTL